jgi:hypothetical protein
MTTVVHKTREAKSACPICGTLLEGPIGKHIRNEHGEKDFAQAVIKAKEEGLPDREIGLLFGISFRQLEEVMTQTYGVNISALKKPRKIRYWEPRNFKEEFTTVWSFKQRGDWATHDGRYRGNWSPYIPRNVIVKYSRHGDIVLDYFVGSGTTAVEAKLLGRRCIARDVNPACIALTLENLRFTPPQTLFPFPIFEPEVMVGDARDLSDLPDNSVDLICAHPPYAGIINYSTGIAGDLSQLSIPDFLREMKKVAAESLRVLKPGKKCAILVGDTRRQKHVVPVGFQTINVFLEAGFKLKELVIKRQHNCRSTGFWYEKSIKHNFLLLAHEYLPIFEKPGVCRSPSMGENVSDHAAVLRAFEASSSTNINELETTTVWIFGEDDFEERITQNVAQRYSGGNGYLTVVFTGHSHAVMFPHTNRSEKGLALVFVRSPFLKYERSPTNIDYYLDELRRTIEALLPAMKESGFIVIETRDTRTDDGYILPTAKRIVDTLSINNLWLKELIVVAQQEKTQGFQKVVESLKIVHEYLLVYEVTTS